MLNQAIEYVGDRFNSAVGMGGKTGKVIFRPGRPEIIRHQKRIELRDFVAAKCPVLADAGTFNCRVCPENMFDSADLFPKNSVQEVMNI